MDTQELSSSLYYYTNGKPFLVSLLCEIIDEKILKEKKRSWTPKDIENAYLHVTNGRYVTTNFDDLIKNLENNEDLYNLVYNIAIQGENYSFTLGDPTIALGHTYGITCGS